MTREIFPLVDIEGRLYDIGYQHGPLFKGMFAGSI